MIHQATWLHLRIPFSFFLLPVYLFALGITKEINWFSAALIFIILHFFLYPASNGYNSYFDKDEGSIGGLEKPPPVSRELYYTALLFDAIAIAMGLLISIEFALMVFIYGMVSKAYSHPGVRLKKYAITGWLIAGIFQGFFTFLMVYVGLNSPPLTHLPNPEVIMPAALTTLLLWGSYPMTQIYQHKEDGRRGDETLSRKLGVMGTFYFTASLFLIANIGFVYYFITDYTMGHALFFELFIIPIMVYFVLWLLKTRKDLRKADFRHTMKLNMISACCLNLFFLLMVLGSRG